MTITRKLEKGGYMEVMTDKQYDGILQMIGMILEGCKDLDEAKKKIDELREGKKEKAE
ncbi:MAG: hypothetical protein K2N51_15770 [Lachnospiraceae bacterium]|nr:hypothetical protein [Lachnospiraceae bacterium]